MEMETLVVISEQQQRRGKSHAHRHHHLASPPPSRGFRGINCRTFHSGILSSPPPLATITRHDPKTPPFHSCSEPPPPKHHGKRSRTITITPAKPDLFAGPAFSNSPPPSSLPIPKFSLRQKRSISLELPPVGKTEVEIKAHAKSAPTSPTRAGSGGFDVDTAVATENLRRILHLDISDED